MFLVMATLITNALRTYFTYRFMGIFFEKQEDKRRQERACYVLFFLLTAGGHLLFRSKTINIISNLSTLYLITGCYEKKRRKRLLVVLMIYGVNMGCDFLALHAVGDFIKDQDYQEVFAFVTVFLYGISGTILKKLFEKEKEDRNGIYKGIILAISLASIVLLIVIEKSIKERTLLVTAAISILLIEFLVLCLYDILMKAYQKLEERALLEKQMLIYSHQLDIMMRSETQIQSFRHDMKRHMGELAAMAEKQENDLIRAYIQDMGIAIEDQKEFVSTGNKNIDSLMNYLLGKATQQLQNVEYEITVPSDLKISTFDLNVILGNLIENAIEAAKISYDQWLSVYIFFEKGMLAIEVKNSFSHELKADGGTYKTTKQEPGHGIGLKNVKKVVEKYDGDMEILKADQQFEVNILLYLHEK